MKSDKELFNLAKQYVMLSSELQRHGLLPEHELDEIKYGLEEIRNTILSKGYSIDRFVEYQNMYKEMSLEDYFEFIKTLE